MAQLRVYRLRATNVAGAPVYPKLRIHRLQATAVIPVPKKQLRVHRIEAITVPEVPKVQLRVHRVEAVTKPGQRLRIHRLEAIALYVGEPRYLRVHRLGAVVLPAVKAGADATNLEPWDTVSLAATAPADNGFQYQWTQLSGAPVELTGTGAIRQYVAPAGIAEQVLVFQVQLGSSTDTVSHTVMPATERALIGNIMVPVQIKA